MAATLVHDGLWDVIEPLLPLPKPHLKGGRPRVPDRACLTAFCLFFGVEFLGRCCQRNWAVVQA